MTTKVLKCAQSCTANLRDNLRLLFDNCLSRPFRLGNAQTLARLEERTITLCMTKDKTCERSEKDANNTTAMGFCADLHSYFLLWQKWKQNTLLWNDFFDVPL